MNWDQLRTMLWLRWRLTRNQWSRGGQVNAVITFIALGLGLCVAAAGGIGGLAVGLFTLAEVNPGILRLVWDGVVGVFLFVWTIGVVTELQRSESIDLSRLLHLPVSLRDVFLLNYVASHLSLGLALAVPVSLGLTIGLTIGRGPFMVLLLPAVLGFFFMITAWTYCLRGWLAALMVNPRRRRAIIMGITLAFVVLSQLPNLVMNVWVGPHRDRSPKPADGAPGPAAHQRERLAKLTAALDSAHGIVPFLWLPAGAKSLAEGNAVPALAGAFGMIALGALGLARAYRSTVRFYQGGETVKPARPRARPGPAAPRQPLLVERTLPLLPEETTALALATFRSMTRAPEVKMALAMNVFIFGIMGVGMFARREGSLPLPVQDFVGSGAAVITFLGLMQVLFNQFGFDRDGFRALVLLPVPRQQILLGKNLALFPLALAVFLVVLGLATGIARLSPLTVLAACLQFLGGFLVLSVFGNLASILVPYRMAAGSLKPTKTQASTMLVMMLVSLLFPLAMLPLLLPAGLAWLCTHFGWLPGVPMNLVCSFLLVGLAVLWYRLTFNQLGRLLQGREQRILQIVTQEVE